MANEKCSAEIGELTSDEKFFRPNHAFKKPQKNTNEKHLDGRKSLKKRNDYTHSLWKTKEQKSKKRPEDLKIFKNDILGLFVKN